MPLIKVTTVKLGKDERPEIDRTVLSDEEWNNYVQSQLRMKAIRSKAGKVLTLVTDKNVIVTEVIIA